MRYRAFIVAFLALCLGMLTACSSGPAGATSKDQLTYDDILGTGLANTCPQLAEITRGSIPIEAGQTYEVTQMCVEPKEYFVKAEGSKRKAATFVPGKVLTRYTTALDQVSGTLVVNDDKTLTFTEESGIDFQAITVLLPGGEEVPFMFTVKSLEATTRYPSDSLNASTDFEGEYKVPSYRGAVFLDPKGRGVASGYDTAVALPAQGDSEEYARSNTKRIPGGIGEMSLQVTKVDGETGEISGVFESIQPSDTDLGADEPEEVKIRGLFYAVVAPK
ncbi:MAG: photosystem II manganese-stabilizing polypeptide [Cyanobacteriota bacterium]|nr:photosystem II manganese-stabilizing polypeptide [Cyanobacteriota bacterium]